MVSHNNTTMTRQVDLQVKAQTLAVCTNSTELHMLKLPEPFKGLKQRMQACTNSGLKQIRTSAD
jgi:hypothetical protein